MVINSTQYHAQANISVRTSPASDGDTIATVTLGTFEISSTAAHEFDALISALIEARSLVAANQRSLVAAP